MPQWTRLILPVSIILLAILADYFIEEQIRITGTVLTIVETALWAVVFFVVAWVVVLAGDMIASLIICATLEIDQC